MTIDLKLSKPDGGQITKWPEWTRPKKEYQWADGRSAKELAKAWFPDGYVDVPPELSSLLNSHSRLAGLELIKGMPEFVTNLPERGEGRNHDLWLFGKTRNESVTLCIEAKADEPFGNDTVSEYREKALQRRKRGESTRVPERIAALLDIVGRPSANWEVVRYQLLTAICGTALQAKEDSSNLAVFIVHEFRTSRTTEANLQRNCEDYERFLNAIGIKSGNDSDGHLFGPVTINDIECLVGKAVKKFLGQKAVSV